MSEPRTYFGEPIEFWKDLLEDVTGDIALRLLRYAFYLVVLYGLVRFVKWAWGT